jgi:hypothetical protein
VAVDYGATVQGVRGHHPTLTLTESSQPSETDVEGYIEALSAWVDARVGPLTAATAAFDMAKSLVELGAAAWADWAAHPETVDKAESTYGDRLWAQFLRGLDELLEALGIATEGLPGPTAGRPGVPEWSFPPPLIVRDAGF